MIDYQWPFSINEIKKASNQTSTSSDELYNKITEFFKVKVHPYLILMPSARAALSLILNYYKCNRSHVVFAPKWTSHCVWDIITRFANPAIDLSSSIDYILAVHKWGQIEKISNNKIKSVIIEDSVDSIFGDTTSLFPNNGLFEIISLPKIIGSNFGGLILFKNQEIENIFKKELIFDLNLAELQFERKFKKSRNEPNSHIFPWESLEYKNTTVDFNSLIDIFNCLNNYELNKSSILKRLEYLDRKKIIHIEKFNRIPPVVSIEIKNQKKVNDIMYRNKNISGFMDNPNFVEVGLIPLHFKSTDDFFYYCIKNLCVK